MTQDLPQEIYALRSAKIDTNNIYIMYLALLTIIGFNNSIDKYYLVELEVVCNNLFPFSFCLSDPLFSH